MDNFTFWVVFIFAAITFYRLWSRYGTTPKARVAAMLRRYHALERRGLSEQECLLQLLYMGRGWRNLPHPFLVELVSRLRSKEDIMRFISVSEEYRYLRDHYPAIAQGTDLEAAMAEVACLFANFGSRLHAEGRFKEAEFVQKLALLLQPHQYFTTLPLAATYHETGRHADALPLFERGLAHVKKFTEDTNHRDSPLSPAKCLGADTEITKLQKSYRKMYADCRKALESN